MALKDSRGGREYDKFVADASGDTAMRVSTTSSTTTEATSSGASTTAGYTTDTGVLTPISGYTELLAATGVEGKERIGIQIFNTGAAASPNTQDATYKVWGSLVETPGLVAGGNWTQIGDNINVEEATSAYRAIATTPIKNIAITGISIDWNSAGGTQANTKTNIYIMAD